MTGAFWHKAIFCLFAGILTTCVWHGWGATAAALTMAANGAGYIEGRTRNGVTREP